MNTRTGSPHLLCFISFLSFGTCVAQPSIQFEHALGGSNQDKGYNMELTMDGGYILVGESRSTNGDLTSNAGDYDYWVVKLDSLGAILWQRTLGGSGVDRAYGVAQTQDGGYAVFGTSNSNDGDVSMNHGNGDMWLVRLDQSGNILWERNYGGSGAEQGEYISNTSDGGLVFTGYTTSNDGDVTGAHGMKDYWVVKVDSLGNLLWQSTLGGSQDDWARSVQQTADGMYIVAGSTGSSDGGVMGHHGLDDHWIIKLCPNGGLVQRTTLGGSEYDNAYAVRQTPDMGYVVVGASRSDDGDVALNQGLRDVWVEKLDASGNLMWEFSYGGIGEDVGYDISITPSGNYTVTGTTISNNGDVSGNNGSFDVWVIELDSVGDLLWQQCYGGSQSEEAHSIRSTSDGGYALVGSTSSNNGDVTGLHGVWDMWFVKLHFPMVTHVSEVGNTSFNLYPNPSSGQFTITGDISSSANYQLIDIQGRVVANGSPANGVVDVRLVPDGVYLLQVKDGERVMQSTMVIR